MATSSQHGRFHRQSGMSLIELMVASLVLGIVVIGVTSMMGTGQKLGYGNDLRRQARIRATAVLEDSLYNRVQHTSNYITPGIVADQPIALDSGKAATVPATLRVQFFPEQATFRDPTIHGGSHIPVNYYRMLVTLFWSYEGIADTVRVTKRVPRI